jgi:hypothetical protein
MFCFKNFGVFKENPVLFPRNISIHNLSSFELLKLETNLPNKEDLNFLIALEEFGITGKNL